MDQDTKINHPEGCRCKGCVGYSCSHNGLCGWAGCGRSFSWLRLIIAVLLGLFIFSAGIRLGEMRSAYMGGEMWYGHHFRNTEMMDEGYGPDNGGTTIVVPAPATAPAATPAATAPATPAR